MSGSRLLPWLLLPLLGAAQAQAAGNEARCATLGASCFCSEPLDSASWSMIGGTDWGVGDNLTTTKECAIDGLAGAVITLSGGGGIGAFNNSYTVTSTGPAIAALPAAHTNTRVLTVADGQFVGHQFQPSDPAARRALRFYRYYSNSPAWSFQSDTGDSCNGNKIAQIFPGPVFTVEGGSWSFYGVGTSQGAWNVDTSMECCSGPGPGNVGLGPTKAVMLGKWLRVEVVIHNAEPGMGSPSWIEYYVKNVTDNTPEVKLVDTRIPKVFGNSSGGCPGCADWNQSTIDALTPVSGARGFAIDLFHGTNGAIPCQGYSGIAYVLAAAWSTDTGQRIGPAVEVEGSGGQDTTAPATPTNLLVVP